MQFAEQQRVWKIVDQQNVDSLYQLQAKNYRQEKRQQRHRGEYAGAGAKSL
jgi:two-component system response regulator CitB